MEIIHVKVKTPESAVGKAGDLWEPVVEFIHLLVGRNSERVDKSVQVQRQGK